MSTRGHGRAEPSQARARARGHRGQAEGQFPQTRLIYVEYHMVRSIQWMGDVEVVSTARVLVTWQNPNAEPVAAGLSENIHNLNPLIFSFQLSLVPQFMGGSRKGLLLAEHTQVRSWCSVQRRAAARWPVAVVARTTCLIFSLRFFSETDWLIRAEVQSVFFFFFRWASLALSDARPKNTTHHQWACPSNLYTWGWAHLPTGGVNGGTEAETWMRCDR